VSERTSRLAKAMTGGLTRRRMFQRLGSRLAGAAGNCHFDFDELAKDVARGLSRREALRRVGVGLAGALLASLGLEKVAWAQGGGPPGGGPPSGTCNERELRICLQAAHTAYLLAVARCLVSPPTAEACIAIATLALVAVDIGCVQSKGCPGTQLCHGNICCPFGDSACGDGKCCSSDRCERCVGSVCQPICNPNKCQRCDPSAPFACPSCEANEGCCNGVCLQLGTDQNCSGCGDVCTGGKTCVNRRCQCRLGEADCSGTCVDTASDPKNCGSCGKVCASGQDCVSGTCIGNCPFPQTDCVHPDGTAFCCPSTAPVCCQATTGRSWCCGPSQVCCPSPSGAPGCCPPLQPGSFGLCCNGICCAATSPVQCCFGKRCCTLDQVCCQGTNGSTGCCPANFTCYSNNAGQAACCLPGFQPGDLPCPL
jgi:hypothetical protein